ncbi:MAG TPA: FHA domain-containing protein [Mycobacteriales bacterium]
MSECLRLPGGDLVPLRDGLRLGRSPSCEVTVDEPSVSREHAVVRGRPGRWYVEDLGSRNGTRVNVSRLTVGHPFPLRHEDRVLLGAVELVVLSPAELDDVDRTSSLETDRAYAALGLSPFQHQVVACLAEPWLAGGEPATNLEIAVRLGTPDAAEAIKAALRRVYAKAGLTGDRSRAKRHELCRFAQRAGWI